MWWPAATPTPSGSITDVVARDGCLHVTVKTKSPAAGAAEFAPNIRDVRDRANPRIAGGCQFPSQLGRLTLPGDYLCVGGSQLSVVDVRDPGAPHIVGSVAHYCEGRVAVDARYAYGGSLSWASMNVFDVTRPGSPSHAGEMRMYADVIDVAVSDPDPAVRGHYALAALKFDSNDLSKVCVVDITRPLQFGKPSLLSYLYDLNDSFSGYGSATCVAVVGDWAYVGHTNSATGLSIVHLGPTAYSYVFDQNPETVPDTVAEGGGKGLAASASAAASGQGD